MASNARKQLCVAISNQQTDNVFSAGFMYK